MKFLQSSFWVRSIFYTLLQRSSLFIFGALSFIALVRAFSKEEFSVWAIYVVIFSVVESVKQGLLRGATIKFLHLPEYAAQRASVRFASLILNFAYTLLIILLVILLGGSLSAFLNMPALQPLLWLFCLQVFLFIPFHHYEIILTGSYKFKSIFWANFLRQFIFFVGVIGLFFSSPQEFSLLTVLWIQILGVLAGTVIMILHANKLGLKSSYHFSKKLIAGMIQYGKYTAGTNLFSQVSRNMDHFLTANLLTAATGKIYVAYYNTVSRIGNMVDVPSLAAADVLFPKTVEILETKGIETVKYYSEKMIATIIAIILPLSVFIFIFPKWIIYIIAGPSYYPAIPLLQITILFSMVRPLSYQFGATMDAIGKPHINFNANLLFVILSLVLNYGFIRLFGGLGPAYAMAVYFCISGSIMIFLLKKFTGMELRSIGNHTMALYKKGFDLIRARFLK